MDQDIRFDKNRGCAVNNMAYDEDAQNVESSACMILMVQM